MYRPFLRTKERVDVFVVVVSGVVVSAVYLCTYVYVYMYVCVCVCVYNIYIRFRV